VKTLNVIGAGRVGRTLASLWEEKHTFAVQDVLDGTIDGARAAVAFIGDGSPVAELERMRPADVWMITTPDREIVPSADRLVSADRIRAGDVLFHCSGSLASTELARAQAHVRVRMKAALRLQRERPHTAIDDAPAVDGHSR